MAHKIGLMGCGSVAGFGHLPAIRDVPGVTLHAVFDPDEDAASTAARDFGAAHACTDTKSFFGSGLDAVVVSSPAPFHEANVLEAAKHKLPVLCEKPLAMTDEESQRMIDAMEQTGVPFYCAFCYRFSPSALEIKELIDSGAIGKVKSLRLIYNWDCHGKYVQDPGSGEWMLNPMREGRMEEGGPMFDCGTHQIDLSQWWLDSQVAKFQGHGAWIDDRYPSPDHTWLHLDHANGAHTCVEISYSYGHTTRHKFSEFVYELIGEDGMIRYDRNHSFFELRDGQKSERRAYHTEKNFYGMYVELAEALRTGQPGNLCTAQTAAQVTRIAREGTAQAVEARIAAPVG